MASLRESRDSDRFLVNAQVQSHALLCQGFGTSVPFICTRAQGTCVWEWLNCMHVDTSEGGAVMSMCGFRSVHYLEVRFGTKDSVRCSEFRGGRFSEVANVQ